MPLKWGLTLERDPSSAKKAPKTGPFANLPFPGSAPPHQTARGSAKTLDQRLGAFECCEPVLNVPDPGQMGLARIVSERALCVLELPI